MDQPASRSLRMSEEKKQAERRAPAAVAGEGATLAALAGRDGSGREQEKVALGYGERRSSGEAGRGEASRITSPGPRRADLEQPTQKLGQAEIVSQRRSKRERVWCGFWTCCIRNQMEAERLGSGLGSDLSEKDLEGVVNADAEHLVILVNGIVGSRKDWQFAAGLLREKLGQRVAIHCSQASEFKLTFDGVDVMGKRLANEVREVVGGMPNARRISFLAHSLGGLVSRYAVSQLYAPSMAISNLANGSAETSRVAEASTKDAPGPTIAGLQPENFITLATPHLGCRGHQQLPFLLGINPLEVMAPWLAHWFIGKSGKHLFLSDGDRQQRPLLRRMATDCKDGHFISSLGAFRKRVAYANIGNDQLVGWRTSAIRRKSENLPKKFPPESLDGKYPHIVREEDTVQPTGQELDVIKSEEEWEDEIVTGLSRVTWHRVDVRFQGSIQAHNMIQVKNETLHGKGKDVIEHIIDKQFVPTRIS